MSQKNMTFATEIRAAGRSEGPGQIALIKGHIILRITLQVISKRLGEPIFGHFVKKFLAKRNNRSCLRTLAPVLQF
jgi:hypothetical protein